jgi:hypothetical protein
MREQQVRESIKVWDDGAPLFLPGDDGGGSGRQRGFVLETRVRPDASGEREQLHLQLRPVVLEDGAQTPRPQGAPIELVYDVRRRAMAPTRAGEDHADLIAWLEAKLGSGRDTWLEARHQRLRGQLEHARTRTPRKVDADRGALIALDELLPHEWDLFVERDGKSYVVLDQYCLEPGCTCGQAAFNILDLDQEEVLGGARFDLETFRLQDVQGLALIDLLWARFLDQGGREAIKARLKLARAAVQTAPASTARVGRNDPCPCGSGKKHKKCCGAAG